MEIRTQPCHSENTVNSLDPEGDDWRTPFVKYLTMGELPDDKVEKRRIAHQGPKYELINGELYRKSFSGPLQVCVGQTDILRVIEEIHEGDCSSHIGSRAQVSKTLRAGYYWPTLAKDTE